MTKTRASAARRLLLITVLLATLAFALAGCGSSASSSSAGGGASATTTASGTSSSVSLAKTKFVLHAGLAFGAFHHFIYNPLRAGDFKSLLSHKLTVVKAGLAAVYVYHELKLALADAQGDPLLSKLVAPITALQSKLASLKSALASGNTSAVQSVNGEIGSLGSLASGAGVSIKDIVPSL